MTSMAIALHGQQQGQAALLAPSTVAYHNASGLGCCNTLTTLVQVVGR